MLLGHQYCSSRVVDPIPTLPSYLEYEESDEDMCNNEEALDPQVMVVMATEDGRMSQRRLSNT